MTSVGIGLSMRGGIDGGQRRAWPGMAWQGMARYHGVLAGSGCGQVIMLPLPGTLADRPGGRHGSMLIMALAAWRSGFGSTSTTAAAAAAAAEQDARWRPCLRTWGQPRQTTVIFFPSLVSVSFAAGRPAAVRGAVGGSRDKGCGCLSASASACARLSACARSKLPPRDPHRPGPTPELAQQNLFLPLWKSLHTPAPFPTLSPNSAHFLPTHHIPSPPPQPLRHGRLRPAQLPNLQARARR